MRIYLTHCSKEKSPQAKTSGLPVTPDCLYTEEGIQTFMTTCQHKAVDWAILSDKYGVFLPHEKHEYYEKAPATVTREEEAAILTQINARLSEYDEIWFYVRPATCHPFYERVLTGSALAQRIHYFENLGEIQ